jgi:hypothetical protein
VFGTGIDASAPVAKFTLLTTLFVKFAINRSKSGTAKLFHKNVTMWYANNNIGPIIDSI